MAASISSAAAAKEGLELSGYIKDNLVVTEVEAMVAKLLEEKPSNPRQWLLDHLEAEIAKEGDPNEISEYDLHRLFEVTRRITSEIVPKETIEIVITETLKLLNCDTVSLFCYNTQSGMLVLHASNLQQAIHIPPGKGIAGSVFSTRTTVNIEDCYMDDRFDRSHDAKTGYVTKSLLAVPILDFDGVAMGVIQAINKKPESEKQSNMMNPRGSLMGKAGVIAVPFQTVHVRILQHLTQHVAVALRNADVYREAIAATLRSTGLLNTIQSLSQDLGTQSLILTITMHANKIVSAERGTVFLVDEGKDQLWSVSTDTGAEIRIPRTAGIAGQCCVEGEVINIPDAYADSRFNTAIDKKTGFKTESILAIPIFSDDNMGPSDRQSIGVIQMINKVTFDGAYIPFDEADVEIMEMFAKFVGPKMSTSSFGGGRKSLALDMSEGASAFGMLQDSEHGLRSGSNKNSLESSPESSAQSSPSYASGKRNSSKRKSALGFDGPIAE